MRLRTRPPHASRRCSSCVPLGLRLAQLSSRAQLILPLLLFLFLQLLLLLGFRLAINLLRNILDFFEGRQSILIDLFSFKFHLQFLSIHQEGYLALDQILILLLLRLSYFLVVEGPYLKILGLGGLSDEIYAI